MDLRKSLWFGFKKHPALGGIRDKDQDWLGLVKGPKWFIYLYFI